MKSFRTPALIAFYLVAFLALEGHAAQTTHSVKVTGGEIIGTQSDSLNIYLGIPFAAPPIGNLRWREPQPVIPWNGIKETKRYASACAQTAEWITHPKSEDCLYLNIWAPEKAKKLPVMVWIHGGGLYGGTAAQSGYDGANLAKRGAVIVTLNYRLGILGFFSHPELTKESSRGSSGNQGILDQIAALRWVQQNITRFGGDPERVTIMGNSSGGESVAILVASPLAKGLFQRAIAESGNDAMPINTEDNNRFDLKSTAEAKGLKFATALGAKNLDTLRKMSLENLQKPGWTPRTFVDGYLLHNDMTSIYRHRDQNDVPLLVGWTAEEGKDLAPEYLGEGDFTAIKYRELVTTLLGHTPSDRLLAAYPGTSDAQAKASINQLTNDWWGWRMVRWAEIQAKYGHAKPYVYFFSHRPAEPLTTCFYGCGVGHGVEIQYVFHNINQDSRPWTTADRQLADRLADTWINFARTGTPNGKGLPIWPIFNGSLPTILRIGDEAELKLHPLPDFSIFPPLAD